MKVRELMEARPYPTGGLRLVRDKKATPKTAILVRERRREKDHKDGKWSTIWKETVHSWKKAWDIAEEWAWEESRKDVGMKEIKKACHKFRSGSDWVLDLGGGLEQRDQKDWTDRLLKRGQWKEPTVKLLKPRGKMSPWKVRITTGFWKGSEIVIPTPKDEYDPLKPVLKLKGDMKLFAYEDEHWSDRKRGREWEDKAKKMLEKAVHLYILKPMTEALPEQIDGLTDDHVEKVTEDGALVRLKFYGVPIAFRFLTGGLAPDYDYR